MLKLFLFLLFLFYMNLQAETKIVNVKSGWNQLNVPLNNININTLAEHAKIIWHYGYDINGSKQVWKAYSKDSEMLKRIALNSKSSVLTSLNAGDGIYLLAEGGSVTFEGDPVENETVFRGIYSQWQSISPKAFYAEHGAYISALLGTRPTVAMRVINDKLVGYSNDTTTADKLKKIGIYEDFFVNEDESFWAKDLKDIEGLSVSDITLMGYPDMGEIPSTYEGGRKIAVDVELTSQKDLNLVHIDLLLVKGSSEEIANGTAKITPLLSESHVIDKGLNQYRMTTTLPFIEKNLTGEYKIIPILAFNEQLKDKNINESSSKTETTIATLDITNSVIASSPYITFEISGNYSDVSFEFLDASLTSKSAYLYDAHTEVSRIARQSNIEMSDVDFSYFNGTLLSKISIAAYGNEGNDLNDVVVGAFVLLGEGAKEHFEELYVFGPRVNDENNESNISMNWGYGYRVGDMKIRTDINNEKKDITLNILAMDTDGISTDTTSSKVYSDILDEMKRSGKKECIDSLCSAYFYTKLFEIGIVLDKDVKNENDGIGEGWQLTDMKRLKVTLFSETFYMSEDEIDAVLANPVKQTELTTGQSNAPQRDTRTSATTLENLKYYEAALINKPLIKYAKDQKAWFPYIEYDGQVYDYTSDNKFLEKASVYGFAHSGVDGFTNSGGFDSTTGAVYNECNRQELFQDAAIKKSYIDLDVARYKHMANNNQKLNNLAYLQNTIMYTSLIANFPLNNLANSSVKDSSGNSNDISLDGDVTQVEDRHSTANEALRFDGASSYGNMTIDLDEALMTMTMWFRTSEKGGGLFSTIDGKKTYRHDRDVYLDDSGNVCSYVYRSSEGTETICSSNKDYADGSWHHIAFRLDGTNQAIFIDGTKSAQGNKGTSYFRDQTNVWLARSHKAPLNNYFEGDIDDFRIYSSALTDKEIHEFYDIDNSLILDLKFDTYDGGKTKDSSGNNNDGTYYSGTINQTNNRNDLPSHALNFDNAILSSELNDSIITTSFWFKTDHKKIGLISSWGDNKHDRSIYIDRSGNICSSVSKLTGSVKTCTSDNNYADNNWHHVVQMLNGVNQFIYVDGEEKGKGDVVKSNFDTQNTIYIGFVRDFTYFTGSIDDVKIYNRVLNQDDINALYARAVLQYNCDTTPYTTDHLSLGVVRNYGYSENVTLTNDRFGKTNSAYYFNGVDSYIYIPNPALISPSIMPKDNAPYSVVAWVRPDRNSGKNTIFHFGTHDNSRSNFLIYRDNKFSHGWWDNDLDTTIGDNIKGEWHMLVAQWDGRIRKLWIDGELYNMDIVTGLNVDNPTFSFGKLNSNEDYFKGAMDDIKVYNYAIPEGLIKKLYHEGDYNPALNYMPTPVAQYNLDTDDWGNDKSGNSNNSSGSADIVSATDRFGNSGKAMHFNGTSSYIELNNNNLPYGKSPYAIVTWIKPEEVADGYRTVFSLGRADHDRTNTLFYNNSNTLMSWWYGSNDISTDVGNLNNSWHMLVSQWDGETKSIWLDGVLQTESAKLGLDIDGKTAYIGKAINNTGFFKGDIDDIKIYNQALNERQIASLFHENGYPELPNISLPTPTAKYTFDGNADDTIGSNDAKTISGASLTKDRHGESNKAYYFDGENDYIDLNNDNLPFGTSSYAFVAWIKPDKKSSYHAILSLGRADSKRMNALMYKDDKNMFHWWYGANNDLETSVGDLSDKWHMLVSQWDGSTRSLWLDGVLQHQDSASGLDIDNKSARIGAATSNQYYFKGAIDDVSIYSQTLSSEQILKLYNTGSYRTSSSNVLLQNIMKRLDSSITLTTPQNINDVNTFAAKLSNDLIKADTQARENAANDVKNAYANSLQDSWYITKTLSSWESLYDKNSNKCDDAINANKAKSIQPELVYVKEKKKWFVGTNKALDDARWIRDNLWSGYFDTYNAYRYEDPDDPYVPLEYQNNMRNWLTLYTMDDFIDGGFIEETGQFYMECHKKFYNSSDKAKETCDKYRGANQISAVAAEEMGYWKDSNVISNDLSDAELKSYFARTDPNGKSENAWNGGLYLTEYLYGLNIEACRLENGVPKDKTTCQKSFITANNQKFHESFAHYRSTPDSLIDNSIDLFGSKFGGGFFAAKGQYVLLGSDVQHEYAKGARHVGQFMYSNLHVDLIQRIDVLKMSAINRVMLPTTTNQNYTRKYELSVDLKGAGVVYHQLAALKVAAKIATGSAGGDDIKALLDPCNMPPWAVFSPLPVDGWTKWDSSKSLNSSQTDDVSYSTVHPYTAFVKKYTDGDSLKDDTKLTDEEEIYRDFFLACKAKGLIDSAKSAQSATEKDSVRDLIDDNVDFSSLNFSQDFSINIAGIPIIGNLYFGVKAGVGTHGKMTKDTQTFKNIYLYGNGSYGSDKLTTISNHPSTHIAFLFNAAIVGGGKVGVGLSVASAGLYADLKMLDFTSGPTYSAKNIFYDPELRYFEAQTNVNTVNSLNPMSIGLGGYWSFLFWTKQYPWWSWSSAAIDLGGGKKTLWFVNSLLYSQNDSKLGTHQNSNFWKLQNCEGVEIEDVHDAQSLFNPISLKVNCAK